MTKTVDPPRKSPLALVGVIAASLISVFAVVLPAAAQSPFSAAARVNDDIVTYYEISQRQQFLQVLNSPDTGSDAVLEVLIDERLQRQAGERLSVVADEAQIEAGVEEFAGRANMGAEQFVRALSQEGVAPETFRDFVAAGITWRNVVRARFGRLAEVGEDEIDRALASGITTGGMRVRLAELIIPITPQNQDTLATELARLAGELQGSTAQFSEAARRFSASPSREAGGLTDWRPLTAVPPQLQQLLLGLSVGQVTDPINLGNAIGLFQLRGLAETPVGAPTVSSIDYLTVAIPGGRSPEALAEAQRLRDAADTCDDFYGLLPGGFERATVSVGDIPSDIAGALSALDEDEASFEVTRSDGTVLLFTMLCERSFNVAETARDEVEQALFQQRLESYASGYLQELRADAIISYPDR